MAAFLVTLDIIRHATFLADYEERGGSLDIYRLNFVADCLTHFLANFVSVAFFICLVFKRQLPDYYIRSFYESALRLLGTIEKWQAWTRARQVIGKLPRPGDTDLALDDLCLVCRVQMRHGGARKLPCGHCFHSECIERWVGQQNGCPLCKCSLEAVLAQADRSFVLEAKKNKPPPAGSPRVYRFDDIMEGAGGET
jgi:hypothetical protein